MNLCEDVPGDPLAFLGRVQDCLLAQGESILKAYETSPHPFRVDLPRSIRSGISDCVGAFLIIQELRGEPTCPESTSGNTPPSKES
jgi:hypothetical protein